MGPSLAQECIHRIIHKVCCIFHKICQGHIPFLDGTLHLVLHPLVGANAPTYIWCNWKPDHPKAMGRKPIVLRRPTAKLMGDYVSTKVPKIDNGALFDLLSMDIINVIDDWFIGLDNYRIFKTYMLHFKCPRSPLMIMHKHEHWILYLYFINKLIY